MRLRTNALLQLLEIIAPAHLAEPWDNVGLLTGNPDEEVQGILIGLDPTLDLLAQARTLGCNTIITHHPIIFHPIKRLLRGEPQVDLLAEVIRSGLQFIACHTNLDSACDGVNDLLATSFALTGARPLHPSPGNADSGMGRIGELPQPLPPDAFLNLVKTLLDPPWLLAAGMPPPAIRRVALCGGSGSSLLESALRHKADVYLTGEVKHADARRAEETGIWLVDAGHFATEALVVPALCRRLSRMLRQSCHKIPIHAARESSPLRLLPLPGTASNPPGVPT